MSNLSNETKAQLEQVSVATLATALFKRGLRNQVIQDVRPVKQRRAIWLGLHSPCVTSAREDRNQLVVFRDPTPQRMQLKPVLWDMFWLWTVGVILKRPQATSDHAADGARWGRCGDRRWFPRCDEHWRIGNPCLSHRPQAPQT